MNALRVAYLVILGACFLASGFFSGSETALIGLPRERVPQLERTRRGRRVADLVADPDAMLSTLLVANNFVNIMAAAIATALFIDLAGEDWGPWLATLVVTAVILVVGEITPKSVAARYPVQFSLTVAPTIWTLSRLLRPLSGVFQGASRALFRLFRIPFGPAPQEITEDDIRTMALLGEEVGEIHAVEREIIHSLFHLADRPVREVMTPRPSVVTLTDPVTIGDVREAVAASAHSHFPVIKDDLDRLIGVLYVKDVVRRPFDPSPAEIHSLLREPVFVPESKPILELLQEMRQRRWGFAVVSDEHGGVEGVVTIKDLIAELTGELQDEYDPGTPAILQMGPNSWVTDGRVPIEDLAAALDRELPAGAYTTIGGLILDLAGRIPDEGDSVSHDGLMFTVLRMDRHRVDRIKVEAGPASSTPDR